MENEQKKKGGCLKRLLIAFAFLFLCLVLISLMPSGDHVDETTKEPESINTSQSETFEQSSSPVQDDNLTMGQKNALKKAQSYLKFSSFSYNGLIGQLEYEGFSIEDATFAVDNCGADWFEQALFKARSYLSNNAFSYSGLIGQLEYEEFTNEQAVYGADNCGADWFEQAAKKAQSYLDHSSFSRSGLIDQLLYEGFTNEQAEYGVNAVGY